MGAQVVNVRDEGTGIYWLVDSSNQYKQVLASTCRPLVSRFRLRTVALCTKRRNATAGLVSLVVDHQTSFQACHRYMTSRFASEHRDQVGLRSRVPNGSRWDSEKAFKFQVSAD
jgi:hypothetical protein